MKGILLLVLANAASLLGASALVRRMSTGSASVDAVLLLVIRLSLISGAVLLCGVTGTLSPIGLGTLSVLALALLGACGEHKHWQWIPLPPVGWAWIVFIIAVGVRLLAQVWFFAPYLGDPLAYHLPKVAEWVRAGAFTREMGVHPHATFPAGFELIETWWVVFLKHDVLIEMAGVEFLILAGASAGALAKILGAGDRSACLAGALYALVPALHLSATSCLNDTPASALVVSTMLLIIARAHPATFLAAAGLGLGIKPTYGFALPGMILLNFLWRSSGTLARPRSAEAFSLAVLGLVLGTCWYARNWIWFGSPFYPLGSASDPKMVQFGASLSSLWANLASLVGARVYDNATLYGPNDDYMAGWGAAPFAIGVMALLWIQRSDPRMRALALAFVVSLLSTLAFSRNDPWHLKYALFFPALPCVATALLSERVEGIKWLAGGTLGFAILGTCLSYDLRAEHLRVLAAQPWRERTAARLAYGQVTREVPENTVGYFGGPLGATYLLYRPDFSRRVVYLRARTASTLVEEAHATGVRWVFAPDPTAEQARILDDSTARGWMKLDSGRFFVLQ
jgi:hypothetical protein